MMKKIPLTFLWIVYIISLLNMSCHNPKKNGNAEIAPPGLKEWTLKYQRGPCFGTCPVYAFYMIDDHTGLIYVHANLMEPGWYTAPLDQKTAHDILMLIEPDAWWHEDMGQQPEIADLPLINLTYFHPNGLRTLTVQKQFTPALSNVFEKLNKLVTDAKWVPTDLRPIEAPKDAMTDVIVQLKEGIEVKEWMKKYENFGIELKRKISPRQQYYLVKKDPSKGDSNDFLQYIKNDSDVVGAEWDQTLEQRKP